MLRPFSKGLFILLMLFGTALPNSSIRAAEDPSPFGGILPSPTPGTTWASAISRMRDAVDQIREFPQIRELLVDDRRALSFLNKKILGHLETTQFQDYYQGLEVVGSTALHHHSNRTSLGNRISNYLARFDLNIRPDLDGAGAVSLARSFLGDRTIAGTPELKILPDLDQDSARLIYWIKLNRAEHDPLDAPMDALIDAHSGDLIAEIPRQMTLARVDVLSAADVPDGDVDPKSGAPLRFNSKHLKEMIRNGRALPGADATAVRASRNAQKVLSYYKNHHNRDSFDNKGAKVVSIVHAGRKFANAFWNSDLKIMAYGDGDGKETRDFTHGLDVAGHEMTHGIVSQTAKLLYFGESGALNEAFADFFGKMIENRQDWVLARDLFIKEEDAKKGIRNLKDPHQVTTRFRKEDGTVEVRPFPAHMRERFVAKGPCTKKNDNCWVHVNSTVWGHATYRIHRAIGKARSERLMYAVMTQFLSSRSGFRNARDASKLACYFMYDKGTCTKVSQALKGVGL